MTHAVVRVHPGSITISLTTYKLSEQTAQLYFTQCSTVHGGSSYVHQTLK